ncbi:SDR family NAD(P)-dependent oxidoreductase [Microbacterium mitrae]|uniref:SDR family NAD(P)-dependent oxidoreductase n=1 Tax=Microbacterium mitrae TaxID=664640 RepID=A0A5C8HTK2_9MICO|nr:SDR family NAD(P)-dependent oxidoreductase [Microbacterium mitrae]TXK06413.1 SDR family NAD(P)-dependent oxidoreductase [Microbacterium mitrae]
MTRELEAGSVVVVTGAGMGMGELYAHRAVASGAAGVALWDIDREQVNRVAADLARLGVTARAYVVNVADRKAVAKAAAQTLADFGRVDVLINNAGIVRGKRFWEHDAESDIELTMQVNTLAPMWITRELLPAMMKSGRRARILNVASAAGTLANPGMSVYAASKWAMIGWSESLRLELEADKHPQITVTTFCPSYISTGMFAGARGPLLTPIMTPKKAVDAAWNGLLAGRALVMKPWTVKLAMALRGVLPTRAWDVIAGRVFHVYSSMDAFTGRPGAER